MSLREFVELLPDERILLRIRAHWFVVARNVAVLLVSAMLAPLLLVALVAMFPVPLGVNATIAAVAVLLWFLALWIVIFWTWTNYYLTRWLITNRRIVGTYHSSLFENQNLAWSTDLLKEVLVRKAGPFQEFFDYGTIVLHVLEPTEGFVELENIGKPEHVQATLLKQESRAEELAAVNQRQTGLLHFMSHEVKGYLTRNTAVFSSIAEGDFGAIPKPLQATAGTALSDTRKGIDTVLSILDTSDFGSGAMKLQLHPFDMRESVLQVARDFTGPASTKGLILEVQAPVPCMVMGDREKLERHVIRNLIDNSIKYTPRGFVRVMLTSAMGRVRFSVADSGVGITPADMERLFMQGGKGADSTKVNADSTGYGLFVSKSIVDAHGGTIRAHSAGQGKGSEFIVELPVLGTGAGSAGSSSIARGERV